VNHLDAPGHPDAERIEIVHLIDEAHDRIGPFLSTVRRERTDPIERSHLAHFAWRCRYGMLSALEHELQRTEPAARRARMGEFVDSYAQSALRYLAADEIETLYDWWSEAWQSPDSTDEEEAAGDWKVIWQLGGLREVFSAVVGGTCDRAEVRLLRGGTIIERHPTNDGFDVAGWAERRRRGFRERGWREL